MRLVDQAQTHTFTESVIDSLLMFISFSFFFALHFLSFRLTTHTNTNTFEFYCDCSEHVSSIFIHSKSDNYFSSYSNCNFIDCKWPHFFGHSIVSFHTQWTLTTYCILSQKWLPFIWRRLWIVCCLFVCSFVRLLANGKRKNWKARFCHAFLGAWLCLWVCVLWKIHWNKIRKWMFMLLRRSKSNGLFAVEVAKIVVFYDIVAQFMLWKMPFGFLSFRPRASVVATPVRTFYPAITDCLA